MPSGPKTNKYSNWHSEEARQRDDERRTNQKAAASAAREDAMWEDNSKANLKRLEKQREAERKAAEKATRDAEKKEQLQSEESEGKALAPHIQKRMTQKELSKMLANYDKEQKAVRGSVTNDNKSIVKPSDDPLPSGNVNQARGIQNTDPSVVTASGSVGQVLGELEKQKGGDGVPDDRHIGKRARVLYKSFFAENIGRVKEEHPNLRRTQYNDVIWEKWLKCPNNPFVMRMEMRDRARLEDERRWMEGGDSDEEGEEEEEEDAAN